jgi:multidrug efflux pump subunit AcrA (membrane-fusion protein)
MSLALPPSEPKRSLSQTFDSIPSLGDSPTSGPPAIGDGPTRKFPTYIWLGGGAIGLLIAAGLLYYFTSGSKANRPDLLLHTVKRENLDLTVVERGTLESTDNRDVICHVKAGSKGSYASTIKWVIDDGTLVKKGQLLMTLDSSLLEDNYRAQKIKVDQAQGDWIKADNDYRVQISQNETDIEKAKTDIALAEIDLEKYVGIPKGTLGNRKREEARGLLLEMEASLESFLARHKNLYLEDEGEYQKNLADLKGQIELADADVEMWKDRVAFSQRMQLKGFISPAQAQADESRLAGSRETLKKVKADKQLLQSYAAQAEVKKRSAAVQEAWRTLERVVAQAAAKEAQTEAARKTARSVYLQQEDMLKDIEEQLRECKIHAPQDGMVVYYIPESSRWSQTERGLIQQGASVQEGQKMMRIPDLKRMQVTTRVHEAMVSRIRGDDRRSTGVHESVHAALLLSLSPINALLSQQEEVSEKLRQEYQSHEYYEAARGMPATIRVDAFPEQMLKGHVRTVATVASSSDFMTSDVKVYQTVVGIDDQFPGLKPGMSAEVTIHVDKTVENVLAIPVQAVIGGAESGRTRKIFVMTPNGPEEKEIEIGLSNEKMAEVRSGLNEGDEIVVNPKAILGKDAKTREDVPDQGKGKGKDGKGKGKDAGAPGGSPGGGGVGKGGPPAKQ